MSDLHFMQRALQLAALGRGSVSPNPMVGCVIVHNGLIIGEGWHRQYGQAHAEVNAINSVQNKELLSASTAFVTLEPCAHFGKTPPCADLLATHRFKRVVVCNLDPNQLVAGKGIEKLRNAGIEVEIGLLEIEGRQLNQRFFTMIEQKRPYFILKFAQTSDGFIAKPNFEAVQISGESAKKQLHQWRTQEDGIMVGFNTALNDNPQLTARNWPGKNPTRVVIDRNLQIPANHQVFDSQAQTIVLNQKHQTQTNNIFFEKINFEGSFFKDTFDVLLRHKIQSVILEGGSKLLQSFIDAGFYDEFRIFESQKPLGEGIAAPILPKGLAFKYEMVGEDLLKTWVR